MNRRVVIAMVSLGVVVVLAAVAVFVTRPWHHDEAPSISATVPVAIDVANVPDSTSIGVVVTLGDAASTGTEWTAAAQGALVAQRRLSMGGTRVAIVARNDHGTVEGAREAVASLVEEGVSGVVVATSGEAARVAASEAATSGVPVVLPYTTVTGSVRGVYSLAPSRRAGVEAMEAALLDADRVLVADVGGGVPEGVDPVHTVVVAPGEGVEVAAQDVAVRTGARLPELPQDAPEGTVAEPVRDPADAVVISGPPLQQAAFVTALQQRGVLVPLVLAGDATSPVFAGHLSDLDGAVSGQLVTVGAAWGDSVALQQDDAGRSMSAFLTALRILSEDVEATNLTGDATFASVAAFADSRSHDAVLALVHAVSTARSADPAEVADSLRGLRLGAANGLAGPVLDFSGADALQGAVMPRYASRQDLGLRPSSGGATGLVWIARPSLA